MLNRFNWAKPMVKGWFIGEKYGTTFMDLTRTLLYSDYERMSRQLIEGIEKREGCQVVHFKGYPRPLLCHEYMSVHDIAKVAFECMVPWNAHYYEREPTAVRPDDVVLDCGAAEGMFTFTVADRCARVYAIDPLPSYTKMMQKSFKENRNVEVKQGILSDKNGMGKVFVNGLCTVVDTKGDLEVEMRTVDSIFLEQGVELSYLKADIEGHEAALIRGSEHTIKELKPRIVLTTYHYPQDAKEVTEAILKIDPSYQIQYYGISLHGTPFMLRAIPSP